MTKGGPMMRNDFNTGYKKCSLRYSHPGLHPTCLACVMFFMGIGMIPLQCKDN
jgi:hypothetical protein